MTVQAKKQKKAPKLARELDGLPKSFTAKPQDPEHMDLTKVKPSRKWVRTYRNVSDDEGHLHGDLKLEKHLKKRCAQIEALNLKDLKDPDALALLDELKALSIIYVARINEAENTSMGIIDKYRFRWGAILNHQKKIVTKVLKKKWLEWFRDNYDFSLLRSAQNYMKIASVPKAVNYAFLGSERILEIIRRIGKPSGDDPIGDYLAKTGIDFDPEIKTDYAELKLNTDIAIARDKLDSAGLKIVPTNIIADVIGSGIELKRRHIEDLKLIQGLEKSTKRDLLKYLKDVMATGGKVPPILTPGRKAEQFKKAIDRFIDKTADALDDGAYLENVDRETYLQLKEKVLALEAKFPEPEAEDE
jgi:hypothetical protein